MISRLKTGIAIALVATATVAMALPLAWNALITWGVSLHQTSVTRELESWGQEFSHIQDLKEASRAVDHLRYIQVYYVPGDGYRGSVKTETELEAQRQETLATIVRSLEKFTGKRYGLDIGKWEAWRDARAAGQQDETAPSP